VTLISRLKLKRHLGGTDGSQLANSYRTIIFKVRFLALQRLVVTQSHQYLFRMN